MKSAANGNLTNVETFAEYELVGPDLDSIIGLLRRVADRSKGWTTDEIRNQEYSEVHGDQCLWLFPPIELIGQSAGIALAGYSGGKRFPDSCQAEAAAGPQPAVGSHKRRARMFVANIVPSESSQIQRHEYNSLLTMLSREVARHIRGTKVPARVRSSIWALEDIVPGLRARKSLIDWLRGFPKTFHPCDVKRLDIFIATAFRMRTKIVPEYIGRYLVEDLGWTQRDAQAVENRIVIGMEVLAVANRG